MADNVAITAGSGTSIATDDVSSVHYQKIKLYAGSDGDARRVDQDEDSAHTSGDPGVPVLAVRRDTPAVGSGTDGDYSTLNVGPSGELWTVDLGATASTTGSLAVADDVVSLNCTGLSAVSFVVYGTHSDASVRVEVGDGTRWVPAPFEVHSVDAAMQSVWAGTSFFVATNDTARIVAGLNGATHARLRLIGIDSGSVSVTAQASSGEPPAAVRTEIPNEITDISVASSDTTGSLVAANADRLAMFITNTDANMLYIRYGSTAATTSAWTFQIPSGATWEMPKPTWRGAIQAIWAADGAGAAIGGELSVVF